MFKTPITTHAMSRRDEMSSPVEVISGYRHHHFRDDDDDEGPEESKTNGEILRDCSKKAMELIRRFYHKLRNSEVPEDKKKHVAKAMNDYLEKTKAPYGPSVKLCERLVMDLLKIIFGKGGKKPEGTKPPAPEGTKPPAPEGTKPPAPEGTKPPAPEGTKPPTPKPTTQSVQDSIEEMFEEEDEEVKPTSSINEQCKALAMKKFKEIEDKVKAFLAAKPTKKELSDHVYTAMKDAYKVKHDEVTMEKCFEHGENFGQKYLMGLVKKVFAHLLGISKPTEAPTTAPDIEDYW